MLPVDRFKRARYSLVMATKEGTMERISRTLGLIIHCWNCGRARYSLKPCANCGVRSPVSG